MIKHFGKAGRFFFHIVRGHDPREVQPNRETKSVGAEDTFPYDLTTTDEMCAELDKIARILTDRLERNGLKGRTITLKLKYHDFKQVTRSHSLNEATNNEELILTTAKQLLTATDIDDRKIRLLGISLSNFGDLVPRSRKEEVTDQLKLF